LHDPWISAQRIPCIIDPTLFFSDSENGSVLFTAHLGPVLESDGVSGAQTFDCMIGAGDEPILWRHPFRASEFSEWVFAAACLFWEQGLSSGHSPVS